MTPDLQPVLPCEVYNLDAAELAALATDEVAIEVGGRRLWVGRTEVSQAAWSEVMGENPSNSHYGCGSDHPIERVNWFDAMRYANRLSQRMGLQPAYRLREHPNRFRGWTRKPDADGYVRTRGGRVVVYEGQWRLRPDSDGYRLPLVEEWTWAVMGDHVLTTAELCVYGNVLDEAAARVPNVLAEAAARVRRVVGEATGGLRPEGTGVVVQGPSGTFESLHFACDDGYPRLAPVGSFLSPSGLVYDGVGNAQEWVVLGVGANGGVATVGGSYLDGYSADVTTPSTWVSHGGLRLVRSRTGD